MNTTMKNLLSLAVVAGLMLVGCTPTSPPNKSNPAKPQDTSKQDTNKQPTKTETPPADAGTISLDVPKVEVADKDKGEEATIKVKREGGYKGDVKLEFDTKDAGVKIEPVTVPADKDEAKVMIKPEKDSKGGKVTVIGKGDKGQEAKATMDVMVK
jgi:hypothetical protein